MTGRPVRWCLALASVLAMAQTAARPGPSELYIVTSAFSDNGPGSSYFLLELIPAGSDSLVRYTRIGAGNFFCPRLVVQTVARVVHKSVAALVAANDPCRFTANSLQAFLKPHRFQEPPFEAASFGIVAQCGSNERILSLPAKDFDNSDKARTARLWNLEGDIAASVFGRASPFRDEKGGLDLSLQVAAQSVVESMKSGRYDPGVAAAQGGNGGFAAILANYQGPITATQLTQTYVPQLRNAEEYKFDSYIVPEYTKLAMLARISGAVSLELQVDSTTGQVHEVKLVSGHPLLSAGAVKAARQWRFHPGTLAAEKVNITMDFNLTCPL